MSKLADGTEARSSSRVAGRKAAPVRKVKKGQEVSTQSNPRAGAVQVEANAELQAETGDTRIRSHLEKGIVELMGLHDLLLTSEVDPDVLADFRDALNRVRNTAWVAQQYVIRKETEQDSSGVLSLLAGERIRAAYQLCEALTDDLRKPDIEFQRGSLAQLYEATKTLTAQLKELIDKP
jgi:hypothetical protein